MLILRNENRRWGRMRVGALRTPEQGGRITAPHQKAICYHQFHFFKKKSRVARSATRVSINISMHLVIAFVIAQKGVVVDADPVRLAPSSERETLDAGLGRIVVHSERDARLVAVFVATHVQPSVLLYWNQ